MSNEMSVGSQGAKRSAVSLSDESGKEVPLASTTRISLDDVQGVVDSAMDKQQKGIQVLLANLSKGMEDLDKETRTHTQTGFNELGSRVDHLEAAQRKQETINVEVQQKLQDLQAKNESLEKSMHVAHKQAITREDVQSDKFDRPANLEVIKVRSHIYVSKRAVEDSLAPWLNENGIKPEEYTLEGNEPQGKFFTLRFCVNPLSNARMVETSLKSLKDKNGKRKEIKAKLPNNREQILHIGGDENDQVRTKRRMVACFKKALEALKPDMDMESVFCKWYKSSIFCDKLEVCMVDPKSRNIKRDEYWWNKDALTELQINKDVFLDKIFSFVERPEEKVQWSL